MTARIMILGVAAVAGLFLLAWPRSERAAPLAPRDSSSRDDTRDSRAQLRGQLAEHARSRDQLRERISELEGRLNEMERAAPAPEEQPQAASSPLSDFSDAEIATWMDRHLESQPDAAATQQAASQINAAIALIQRADLHVENMSCGQRFCRASFYQDNGERPVVRDLYGAPPITGEGFTVEEADGRLGVYFARNGERVADFREEALLATAP